MKGDRLYLGHIRVSADTRAAHPEVPWKDMAGMRDRVVHDYFGVSLAIVWDVITKHLPQLRESFRKLLDQESR